MITGIGVVAPNGVGTSAWWEASRLGVSGVKRISRFDPSRYPIQLAGEIDGFEPTAYLEERLALETDRSTWMALAATQMALNDADFDPGDHPPTSMGVAVATAFGGAERREQDLHALWEKGPGSVGAHHDTSAFYAAAPAHISISYGMKGPIQAVSVEGVGGLAALVQARRIIRRGADAIVCGGAEAPITPYALVAQWLSGGLSCAHDPIDGYRPFDAGANGSVPGEGAVILLVEELEEARRRGAPHVYGEIAGYGATHDAHHFARPAPDGRQLTRSMSLALGEAGVNPEDVNTIFADAAGTPEGDALEVRAITEVFGDRSPQIPITAPKSMVGRLYAAGGPLDVAAALLSMRDQCVPPIVNLSEPARGYSLNFVTGEAQNAQVDVALVNARGFAGFNNSLVLRRVS